jgi:crotonobetainyl-CoA:carnitine CoA-transferase CaiB-like acyl-CoA transferase
MRQQVQHPWLGTVPLLGSPLAHFSRTPAQIRSHPPLLGEHTQEVLHAALGLSLEEISALEAAGVVKTHQGRSTGPTNTAAIPYTEE